jgi:chromosome segregation ATPase
MAEVTNELLYEVLKAMQARLGNVEERLGELRGEVHALRAGMSAIDSRMGALHLDIANLYESTGAMDSRLYRIERRLEITDVPGQ